MKEKCFAVFWCDNREGKNFLQQKFSLLDSLKEEDEVEG